MYFLAWSKSPEVRTMATSGGFTKEILKYALVSGYVDYIVFPVMRGTKSAVVATQDYAELMTPRSNSVYLPISSLKGLRDVPEGKTCAMTLLPCHAMLPRSPKIKLMIELVCNHTPTRQYLQGILARMGIPEEDVLEFSFRSGVWPGMVSVTTSQGVLTAPYIWDNDVSSPKAPEACRRCDRIEKTGDFIVGDPWEIETPGSGDPGKTMVKVVNPDCFELMQRANVEFTEITEADWLRSTAHHNQLKEERRANFR